MDPMCLGRTGTVVDLPTIGCALVEFDEGDRREVSTAVLHAEGDPAAIGDRLFVSMGLALRRAPDDVDSGRPWR